MQKLQIEKLIEENIDEIILSFNLHHLQSSRVLLDTPILAGCRKSQREGKENVVTKNRFNILGRKNVRRTAAPVAIGPARRDGGPRGGTAAARGSAPV